MAAEGRKHRGTPQTQAGNRSSSLLHVHTPTETAHTMVLANGHTTPARGKKPRTPGKWAAGVVSRSSSGSNASVNQCRVVYTAPLAGHAPGRSTNKRNAIPIQHNLA